MVPFNYEMFLWFSIRSSQDNPPQLHPLVQILSLLTKKQVAHGQNIKRVISKQQFMNQWVKSSQKPTDYSSCKN